MTALQSFKAALVPHRKVTLRAQWTKPEGEPRTVGRVRTRDVSFFRPDGRESWLSYPKAAEVTEPTPGTFVVQNPGAAEVLTYVFEPEGGAS